MNPTKITTYYLNGKGGASETVDNANDQQVVWHHLKYTDKTARNWIKKRSDLSDQARMTLLNSETRPRAQVNDNELLLCLRGINFNDNEHPEDMISIRLWMNKQTVITSSNHGSQSVRNIRSEFDQNHGPKNTEQLLVTLIENLAKLTDDFVDKMDQKIDSAEDQIDESKLTEFNPQMNQLRRQIANIRRYLLPQKEALEKLYRYKSPLFSESFYEQVFVYADKFMQLIENLDLMRERALMLQEHFMANISHQQNSRLYLLAIISVIFLPLTFLSGLFGMNVAGMPGLEDHKAFWYIIIFSLSLTVLLLVWFKKSRWF
ncbi:CorA family divalent cation transporter [Marinicella litoralis]|uniref:Zinc transporter n=1 Tax=Marinicella litoralis TaxID=644220 RepID=A0A4V3DHH5_9GAMM|nr:CorA family divalent cation transporter [Marinicella litoralis]TDR18281.1 zinc transporter [Marinicella litoralis]